MILPREDSPIPSAQQSVGHEGAEKSASEPLELLLRQVKADLSALTESLKRTVFVEMQRIRLKAIEGVFRGGLYVCLAFAGVVALISAVVMLVLGLRGALAALTGSLWIGDLLTAAILIGCLCIGGLIARSKLRAEILRSTEKRLGPLPSPRSGANSTDTVR